MVFICGDDQTYQAYKFWVNFKGLNKTLILKPQGFSELSARLSTDYLTNRQS